MQGGIQINGKSLTNIRYTDDTVLLAENEQELQEIWSGLQEIWNGIEQ